MRNPSSHRKSDAATEKSRIQSSVPASNKGSKGGSPPADGTILPTERQFLPTRQRNKSGTGTRRPLPAVDPFRPWQPASVWYGTCLRKGDAILRHPLRRRRRVPNGVVARTGHRSSQRKEDAMITEQTREELPDRIPDRKCPDILDVRETGEGEPVDFRFGLRCTWCGEAHAIVVRRTLLFLRDYACPSCGAPLRADGRQLRQHLPRTSDSPETVKFEDRLQELWHDLHRAEGAHPAEAQLLCQTFTSHVTRIASASFSKKGPSA
jgi:hypothetical protein